MSLGFSGAVVDYYQRYRRGYPDAVIDALVQAFGLGADDVVADIGCGTGQLTLPIAGRVRAAVGIDPEPDMLARARHEAGERGVRNVTWILGADTDLPALGTLLGPGSLGAATVGQALHWMDHPALFRTLRPALRPGGGIAVVANGAPLWLQDTAWSAALREILEQWTGTSLTDPCGTDDAGRRRYAAALEAAGYRVGHVAVDFVDELDLDRIVGGALSAFPEDQLPTPQQQPVFAERVRRALAPDTRFTEQVHVTVLTGTRP